MQSSQRKLNRRAFVKTAATASTAFAVPQIIPSDVLAAVNRPGANDRLIMGHIGVGGMGGGHLRDMINRQRSGQVAVDIGAFPWFNPSLSMLPP